jgi:hypothetical protein
MNRETGKFRRALAVSVAAVVISGLVPASVFAGEQDFTLHNATGKEISELYVSSADTEDWEEDILGEDTLATGASVSITFPKRARGEKWDMKVVFSDGKSSVWTDLRLTEITDITISYKNGKPYATTKNGD